MAARFTSKQLDLFKATLNQKLSSISSMEREHENEALHRPEELANDRIMPADWSSETSTMGVNLQLADQEIQEAQEIESALQRLGKDTYGLCEECEELIPFKRLEVQPEARLCVRCEQEIETNERRMGYSTPEFKLEEPNR